jgi:hypothetical protein
VANLPAFYYVITADFLALDTSCLEVFGLDSVGVVANVLTLEKFFWLMYRKYPQKAK